MKKSNCIMSEKFKQILFFANIFFRIFFYRKNIWNNSLFSWLKNISLIEFFPKGKQL